MRSGRSSVFVIVAGVALVVSGCSSSSGESGGAAAPATTTQAAATATEAGADEAAGIADRLASRLCTALSKTTADMKKADASSETAMVQISLALVDVYGDDVAQMDAGQIEAATEKTCPDVHDEAVKVMKVDSLSDLR